MHITTNRSSRIFIIVFNSITLAFSIFLMATALSLLVTTNSELEGSRFGNPVVVWIGLILALVGVGLSLVGWLGAYYNSKRMLSIYVGGLVTLIIIQLVVTVIAIVQRDRVDSMLDSSWNEASPDSISRLEQSFACCGFHSPNDRAVPVTCSKDPSYGFQRGCQPLLVNYVKSLAQQFYIAMLVVILVQLAVLVMSMVMLKGGLTPDPNDDSDEGHQSLLWSGQRRRYEVIPETVDDARRQNREGINPSYQVQQRT